ncbi:cob(I)yrinic acid a,c-diamide adenosyltransferase [Arenibacter certesii]|uniref:Corrinoid adenosyltransferase n=1 Tax=Arenibacter certesii TaxID=228955 RepID=A0A918IW69_9FLAO|nr:cob(I)yrinic acid a,c-diamide adenosyltransferase [Arenibacter certesii]GGW33595.1 cobalamin adenosyltransferase [Arenibacter certesii]
MKIYTKTGDDGTTGLFGGTRVPKYHIRIESYGTIDELNSWIGLIKDQEIDSLSKKVLKTIQENLFTLGALLAIDPAKEKLKSGKDRLTISKIGISDLEFLEQEIDRMEKGLVPMTHFILPGGHPTVSYCHISRTICRRAERLVAQLHQTSAIDPNILAYINRLSDFLFVLARNLSKQLKAEEILWIPDKKDQ